jgi:hypothetical protein
LVLQALKSYARAIHLMADKEVFDVTKLDFAEFAKSLGLLSAPTIKVQEVKKVDKHAVKLKQKLKMMEEQLDEIKKAKKQAKAEKLSKRDVASASGSASGASGEEQSGSDDEDSSDDEGLIPLKKKKQRKTGLQKMLQRKNTDVLSEAYLKMRGASKYVSHPSRTYFRWPLLVVAFCELSC